MKFIYFFLFFVSFLPSRIHNTGLRPLQPGWLDAGNSATHRQRKLMLLAVFRISQGLGLFSSYFSFLLLRHTVFRIRIRMVQIERQDPHQRISWVRILVNFQMTRHNIQDADPGEQNQCRFAPQIWIKTLVVRLYSSESCPLRQHLLYRKPGMLALPRERAGGGLVLSGGNSGGSQSRRGHQSQVMLHFARQQFPAIKIFLLLSICRWIP